MEAVILRSDVRRFTSPTCPQSAFPPNIAFRRISFFFSPAPSIQRDRFLQIIKPRYFIGRYRRRGDKRLPRAIFVVAAAVGRSSSSLVLLHRVLPPRSPPHKSLALRH